MFSVHTLIKKALKAHAHPKFQSAIKWKRNKGRLVPGNEEIVREFYVGDRVNKEQQRHTCNKKKATILYTFLTKLKNIQIF